MPGALFHTFGAEYLHYFAVTASLAKLEIPLLIPRYYRDQISALSVACPIFVLLGSPSASPIAKPSLD